LDLTERAIPSPTEKLASTDRIVMIVLGIILLVVGYLVPGLAILATIGWILVAVGIILAILGAIGRPVGGRKVWF
jgi:protein-S-isoprenylcysteine O-methyltransferase Ste14